jgi:hypothetical protein
MKFRSVLTRILTAKQATSEAQERVIEMMTTETLRNNPKLAESGDVPAPSFTNFNEGVRAANRDESLVVAAAGADVNGVAPPPSLNASIMKFLKKGFSR